MLKLNPISSVVLSLLALPVYAAPPTVTVSPDGQTITYAGGDLSNALTEDGSIQTLEVNGVTINNNQPITSTIPALISLGGDNGIHPSAPQDYGGLSITVDNATRITSNQANAIGIYTKTDSTNATTQITSGATINFTGDDTQGILLESKNGNAELTLTDDSYIYLSGNNAIGATINAQKEAIINTASNIEITGTKGTGLKINAEQATINTAGVITLTNGEGSAIDYTGTGDVTLNLGGWIQVAADNNSITSVTDGATSSSGVKVAVDNGDITTTFDAADGLLNILQGSTNASDMSTGFSQTITGNGNNSLTLNHMYLLNMSGNNSAAIYTNSSGGQGDTTIVSDNIRLAVKGSNADIIHAINTNQGGNINITLSGYLTLDGVEFMDNDYDPSNAVYASKGDARGDVTINMVDNFVVNADSSNIQAFVAEAKNGNATINLTPTSGSIVINAITDAKEIVGLSTTAGGAGNLSRIDVSDIMTIQISSNGTIEKLVGIEANGIDGASAMINMDTFGSLFIGSTLSPTGTAVSATSSGGNGDSTINIKNGAMLTGADYIVLATTEGTGNININLDNIANIFTSFDSTDVIHAVTEAGNTNINISNTMLRGGSDNGVGVYMETASGNQTLNNWGDISAVSDHAIVSKNDSPTATTIVNNYGKTTGYVTLGGNKVTFNNTGTFDLQHIDNHVKQTSISDIGTNGSGTFNNTGILKYGDANFYAITYEPTQAIINAKKFTNAGVINLTHLLTDGITKELIGNSLTINGNYVSNGGSLIVNTLINDDPTPDGLSDKLIVNGNITTGAGGSTKITIRPTADSVPNLLTSPNGIKVVEVNGHSSNNAFSLASPLLLGEYEYLLRKNPNQSWYLVNYSPALIGGDTGARTYTVNPSLGAYLGNQTIATEMFNMSLFDRLISSASIDNDAEKELMWMRTQITHEGHYSVGNALSTRSHTYMAQIGSDLAVWKLDRAGYVHLGFMMGYGDHENNSTSRMTRTKAEGKVKGYNTGLYASYFANRDTQLGLYLDTWSQMNWFRNRVEGKGQNGTKSYNSTVWSNSIEAGYGISLTNNKHYEWLATPQLQLTYHLYDAKNQQDKNYLHISGNKASGLVTRTGLRIQGRGVNKPTIEPFAEVNWLNTTAKNQLKFNGRRRGDGMPKSRYDANVGLQGNLNQRWSVSAQMGGLWGKNNYNAYQGQFNINYRF